ncbi:uncharacterized protein CANTADRAFT_197359 [Suhomyces tanzawaensis NRRL Y-17324]|uniref:Uncharacterized protein n=1 Tax=Suhomyces tanzawaensis NRRL Y-17324 TaxID=984487 RepID=A0A1E4SP15_9ASCO|nr:uncharacterized protein CANTADRAFT_197359 [Suhomyces tanzawaensis NRRL Y-17324]ODV81235.1 hypothetical protein CANTADRAFT_197359 [Suhomyces tanzawaensis NRRL Y-17324]
MPEPWSVRPIGVATLTGRGCGVWWMVALVLFAAGMSRVANFQIRPRRMWFLLNDDF